MSCQHPNCKKQLSRYTKFDLCKEHRGVNSKVLLKRHNVEGLLSILHGCVIALQDCGFDAKVLEVMNNTIEELRNKLSINVAKGRCREKNQTFTS